MRKPYTWAAETHIGLHRPQNEDRYAIFTTPLGEAFLVCDGMGGGTAGEIAASLATEKIQALLQRSHPSQPVSYWLRRALHYAHREIQDYSQKKYGESVSGTTVTLLLITPSGQAWWACVGDSPLYLLRGNTLYPLTQGHRFTTWLVESGALRPELAETHPARNQILFALGIGDEFLMVEAPTFPLPLQRGDILLLCSDGISDMLSLEDLANLLKKENTPSEKVRSLVEAALQAGGYDNATLILIQVEGIPTGSLSVSSWKWIAIAGATGLGIGLALGYAFF
ncbi:MAG: SpoIIE family protein phosphatase [Bacteroidia bacterium]|nr:SpoIIE family protein phosphatase [Bacteroidia bacterium]MDW8235196.1 SpoIIE family protein phosphatase [Bacteroidia bacterium]